ncbi:MAG: tRNA-dihydrouridine synthase [Planctomycetales bacterium]
MSLLHETIESPVASSFAAEDPRIAIGPRTMPSRYFLAPLAGYTHLAFRTAVRELGGMGLATTDLVQATTLLSGRRKALDLIATSPADRPLSVQIFSGKVGEFVKAARFLAERGYEGIDINMGCPMAKINGQGGGARLMCDTDGAVRTVADVVEAVDVPVTVKMRLGWDRENITAPVLAREFEKVGAAAITIHGRTRQQGFQGDVHLDGIRATVEAVDSIPVIGNGDVRSVADAFHMRRATGCAAVAIGRGALLDPWIFRRLARRAGGVSPPVVSTSNDERTSTDFAEGVGWAVPTNDPTADEQLDFLVRHFTLMADQHGDYACTLFRKFAGWYGARLGVPEDLEDRLRRFASLAEFESIMEEVRDRQGERKSTVATALVKVPNGPVEHW